MSALQIKLQHFFTKLKNSETELNSFVVHYIWSQYTENATVLSRQRVQNDVIAYWWVVMLPTHLRLVGKTLSFCFFDDFERKIWTLL